MDYATGTARLVEPGHLAGRGVAAVLDRSEIEQALRSNEPAEMVLDIARQGDVEAHTLGVRWDPPDLEEVLRTNEGERIAIAFDREELQAALPDPDVEGHGLREKALVLTVAAATATVGAGSAQGMIAGGGSSGASQGQPAAAIGGAVAAAGDQSPAEVTGGAGRTPFTPASDEAPASFAAPGDGLSGAEVAGLAGLGGIAITAAAFAVASQRRRRVEPA